MRNFRTSLLEEGDFEVSKYDLKIVCTSEDATRNSLDVRQVDNDKVGA